MKSKYETHVAPNIEKIAAWAQKGATAKAIADKLHVAYSTFRKYLDLGAKGDERYGALSAAFAEACEEPDDNVENALYRRATGYVYEEVRHEEKLDRAGNVVTLVTRTLRDVPPDPTSAMFWLTNRRSDRWKYRPAERDESAGDERGVILIPEVAADGSGG